jgi:hypothetical protein
MTHVFFVRVGTGDWRSAKSTSWRIPTAISVPLFLESAILAPRDNLLCNNGPNNGTLEK